MHRFLILLLLGCLSAGLVACGSDDSDSSSGDDDDGGQEAPTAKAGTGTKTAPLFTGGEKLGSLTYKFGGNVEASGELAFTPVLSLFSDKSWQQLYFGGKDGQTVFIINLDPATAGFMFGDGKISVVGVATGDDAPCTIKVEKQDGTGAKGTFECDDASGTGGSGAIYADGITVKGAFEARTK